MYSDRCEYSHRHSVLEDNSFTAFKIPFVLPVLSPPSPLIVLTFSIVLPFPERRRVGLIQHTAFSDWLLSRSSMLLGFPHLFSWFKLISMTEFYATVQRYHSVRIRSPDAGMSVAPKFRQ